MEKRKIRTKLASSIELEGTIDEAIALLEEYKNDFKDYHEIMIEKDYGDDSSWYDLWAEREETDEEFEKRINLEERNKKAQEDREWNQYLNLRDKLKERILKENLDKILKP